MAADEEQGARYRCPACDAPLFGWTTARDPIDRSRIVLDHCEDCGLVVTRGPQSPDLGELDLLTHERGRIIAPNRESFQGGIGGGQWAAMEPDRRRLHLTPRAARLLLRKRGIEVLGTSTPFTTESYAWMLQTMINAFTLRDNFVRNARRRVLPRQTPGQRAAYALDWLVSAFVAIPLSVVALVAEGLGSLVGRGGRMVMTTAADPEPPAPSGGEDRR